MAKINKHSILLVEDELSLGTIIKETLETNGFDIAFATTISSANQYIKTATFNLFIVDVMLTDGDGFQFVQHLRQIGNYTPVIFLTARSLPEDVVNGFESGGNDYIKKPFSLAELLVRIKHQLQLPTIQQREKTKQNFTIGFFLFSYPAGILTSSSSRRQLTSREADILHLLVTSPLEDISRSQILKQIWEDNDYFSGRSLDVFISKLRKYLSADSSVTLINIRGKGYRLIY